VCQPGVLVVGLIGGAGAPEELRVVAEAAGFGAQTWVLARDGEQARDAPGTISLIGGGLHPAARLPLLLHPAHALALTLALTRGCDPDAPRHLGQVVIIDPP
jgi:fructoselysine-6-P-deglycase FrlB-like protein